MIAIRSFLPLGSTLILLIGTFPVEAGTQVVVKGRGTDLGETPILVALKTPIAPGSYALKAGKNQPISAVVFKDGPTTYLAAVLEGVGADAATEYDLVETKTSGGIELKLSGGSIDVTIGGAPLTTYLADSGPKPYFFPVFGPTGKPITRAFPMKDITGEKRDHPHQRSLWFTHGKVNGIDFWSELKSHGSIKETSRKVVGGGPVGVIRTTDDWIGPDGKRVCTDERVVRFYATKNARVLDFDIVINAVDGSVVFGDTKEGMFGIRVPTSMDVNSKNGGKITNAEGLNDDAAWGKASPWVDYSGPVEGETVGVAILNHPSSFRSPTTWHVRTYGLFAANPFGWKDFGMKKSGDHTIPAGDSIRFGYRVIFHKGDTTAAQVPAAFEAYAKPPAVEVISN